MAGFACAVTCIDPQPRADIGRLPVTLHRRLFAATDAALADGLAPGDILLIDSSHVAMPGSDVDLLLNAVLPRLQPGVLVHLHDIFLPDPYPAGWGWRGYNEQVAVAGLLHGGGYAVRFSSRYLATRQAARVAQGTVASDSCPWRRGPGRAASGSRSCRVPPLYGPSVSWHKRTCPAGRGRSGPAAPS